MSNSLLEEDILFLIGDTARLISTYADRVARRYGLSKAQWVVLLKVARNPGLSQRDLAQMMAVEPISVGRLVDRLESRRLIKRMPDEQDRRIWRLHLLPEADPILAELAERRSEIALMIRGGIEDAPAETIRLGLMQVKANVTNALKGTEPPADFAAHTKTAIRA